MGKNEVVKAKTVIRKGDKKKIPVVKKISYTPETLAAAIAKNIRAEQASRDMVKMLWKQGTWGEMTLGNLLADSHIELDVPVIHHNILDGRTTDMGYSKKYIGVSCPTTGCIAGWATSLAGDVMVVRADVLDDYRENLGSSEEHITTNEVWSEETGRVEDLPARAQYLLGLTSEGRNFLFSEERTLAEVLNVLDTLATGGHVEDSPAYIHFNGSDGSERHSLEREVYNEDTGNWDYTRPYQVDDCEWCKLDVKIKAEGRDNIDPIYFLNREVGTVDSE